MTEAKAETEAPARRRRAPLSAVRTRLDAPQREGYVRRWVDDSPTRIAQMHQLGYDFVQDKADKAEARTDGLGSRVTRMGGKRDDGSPHHLVLMETPVEEFEAGKLEKEDALKPFEEALKSGVDTTGRLTEAYKPRDGSSITHNRA